MKHATSVALYEHWKRLRGSGHTVARSAIEPRDLGAMLPDLFLIETDVANGSPLRFCGASIARRYGRDLDGESFLSFWNGADRALMRRNISHMERRGTGIVLGVIAETAGGGCSAFEMTLLPLRGADRCDGAIGSMVRTGGHDESNRIRSRILAQEVRSFRFLDDDEESIRDRALAGLKLPDQERGRAPFGPLSPAAGRAPAHRGRPHLTLVVGDKGEAPGRYR